MHDLSYNSAQTQRFINTLTQWMKKPNLDFDLSAILDSYATQIHEGSEIPITASAAATNFAEAGLFLQSCMLVFSKQVDLLYKKGLKVNNTFFDLLSTNRENENKQHEKEQINVRAPTPSTSAQAAKKPEHKETKKKASTKENPMLEPSAVVSDQNTVVIKTEPECTEKIEKSDELKKSLDTPREKLELCIQNILNRVVSNPHLQDLDLGILSDDCLGAADESHPLHPIFVMIGDELNIAKDLFTVKDVELTGLCWKILYQLENKLNSLNKSACDTNTSACETGLNVTNTSETCTNTNVTDTDTFATSAHSDTNDAVATAEVSTDNDDNLSDSEQCGQSVSEKELRVCLEQLPDSILSKYTKPSENVQNNENTVEKVPIVLLERMIYMQTVIINLFSLPEKLWKKKQIFKLPSDYFEKDNRLRPRKENPTKQYEEPQMKMKRKLAETLEDDEADIPLKMIKSYDLSAFENFSYEFYVGEGILPPKPVENSRKSVDTRSETSFFCPKTPDSGRFSMSCEYENPDTDMDQTNSHFNDTDPAPLHMENDDEDDCCAASDCGMELSSFNDAGYESDRTIEVLKQIFPNISKNPQMLPLVKEIINTTKPPESEDYLEWKKFIDNKTAGEKEFDIHEFGTNILNAFPDDSTESVVSFENIVQEKSTEEVSRYFVSMLQLANTNNIEISDQHPGQMRSDSIELRLLSRSRYHETFDDTLGVSDEQFMARLTSRRSEKLMQSTPYKVKKHRPENVHRTGFHL